MPLREALERVDLLLAGPDAFDPRQAERTFRLSGTDFFAELLMPPLGEILSRNAPAIRVQLVDLVRENHVDTLERYDVDLALLPAMSFPDWVDNRAVFRSPFVMIARTGHPRLRRATIAPGEVVPIDLFCDLGHVLMSPEGKMKTLGDAVLAELGRERRVVMTVPFFSGVLRAVAASDLVALIPQQLAARMAPQMGLDLYVPPIPVPAVEIRMIWHRRATMNPAHRWLRELVAEILATLDEGPDGRPVPTKASPRI